MKVVPVYEVVEQVSFDDIVVYHATWLELLNITRKKGKGFLNHSNITKIETIQE